MEDWEQHFADKSRRRADKERLERERQRRNGIIAIIFIVLVLIGSVAALAIMRWSGADAIIR